MGEIRYSDSYQVVVIFGCYGLYTNNNEDIHYAQCAQYSQLSITIMDYND